MGVAMMGEEKSTVALAKWAAALEVFDSLEVMEDGTTVLVREEKLKTYDELLEACAMVRDGDRTNIKRFKDGWHFTIRRPLHIS